MEQEKYPLPEVETKTLDCSSVEEAQEICAREWGIRPEDVDVRVVSEGKKLFGLLGSKITVEATSCAPVSYIKSCLYVNEILERMDLDLIPELTEDGTVDLVGEDIGIVIGRFGETLKALEHLTNLVCHRDLTTRRVHFDAAGYKRRRIHSLERLAGAVARDVLHSHKAIALEPMTAWERRIIHLELQDNKKLQTQSVGEDPSRRVVIAPAGMSIDSFEKRPRRHH